MHCALSTEHCLKGGIMDKDIFNSKITELANGIKLITIKKSTELASVHVGIKIGSLYEKRNEKGISHFIEHMLFKGTEKRNNAELNNELEDRGGDFNAYTDYGCTVFCMTVLKEELKPSVELLSDMVINSNFPEDEIQKERGVILAEIRSSKDDVEELSYRKVHEAAFRQSPLRYDTIGTEASVKKFDREQIYSFYRKYYVPNNCYITVVSPYGHETVAGFISEYFDGWSRGEFKLPKVKTENNRPGKAITVKKDIEQGVILYAYTFYGLSKKEEMALRILNNKFGESSNSVLFRELREERGLAYDVYSELDASNYIKVLYIYTSVSEENIENTMNIIDKCLEDLISGKIIFDDRTIYLMKKILKTAVATTMEDSSELGNYVLHQYIDGEDIYEFLNDMKKLDEIKTEDIMDVAQKILTMPTIHVLMPAN